MDLWARTKPPPRGIKDIRRKQSATRNTASENRDRQQQREQDLQKSTRVFQETWPRTNTSKKDRRVTPNRHDIWSGPIVGYENASSMSAGERFEHPGNFEYDPQAENAKRAPKGKGPKNRSPITKQRSHANSSAAGERKTAKTKRRYQTKMNILEQQLAKAARDKIMRAGATKRLRYLQTYLMRLTLALSTHTGDAEEYLSLMTDFPFDESYAIIREAECVIAKSDSSKHLCLKAIASGSKLTLGPSGGKSY